MELGYEELSKLTDREFIFMREEEIFQLFLELMHNENAKNITDSLFSKYESLQNIIDEKDYLFFHKQISTEIYLLLRIIGK